MPSLDSLPGDQRAVLQMVLGRGRSYEDIARLLSINPGSVRERALAALDTLGPETEVPAEHRAQIADYLLGQASQPGDTERARRLLAGSPGERAWARVVASELTPLAAGPLPEIPTEATPSPAPATPVPADEPVAAAAPAPAPPAPEDGGPRGGDDGAEKERPRSSRLGGAVLIAVAVLAVAAVVFFVVRGNRGGSHKTAGTPATSAPAASASTTATTSSPTTTSAKSSTSAKVVAQINLAPPHGGKAAGIAEVLDEGSSRGVAIVAQDVPANSTNKKKPNAYAVWLYNSPTDASILGFVNPGVGKNGRLSTAGALPTNASHYKHLIITLETQAKPKSPGPIVLQGTLTGLS